MTKFQTQKALVLRYHEDLDTVADEGLIDVNRDYTTTDYLWLGIPVSGKMVFLRYTEFHRIEKDLIAETVLFCDIPGLTVRCRGGFMGLLDEIQKQSTIHNRRMKKNK
jgi:hypothetical protein